MPSIIDMVSEAEAGAAEIRRSAANDGRAIVAEANLAADGMRLAARERVRELMKKGALDASGAGAALMGSIQSEKALAAEEQCKKARARVDYAVGYILGEVMR